MYGCSTSPSSCLFRYCNDQTCVRRPTNRPILWCTTDAPSPQLKGGVLKTTKPFVLDKPACIMIDSYTTGCNANVANASPTHLEYAQSRSFTPPSKTTPYPPSIAVCISPINARTFGRAGERIKKANEICQPWLEPQTKTEMSNQPRIASTQKARECGGGGLSEHAVPKYVFTSKDAE